MFLILPSSNEKNSPQTDPPHEERSVRIYSLPSQPVSETPNIRAVKRALLNRSEINAIKKGQQRSVSIIFKGNIGALNTVARIDQGICKPITIQ